MLNKSVLYTKILKEVIWICQRTIHYLEKIQILF
nr:MAG TPA: CpeS-like protein [Caudoviricetes sp.]